jgi:iturin family lipopeptide synthetase A
MEHLARRIFSHVSKGQLEPNVASELLATIKLERQTGRNQSSGPHDCAIIGMSAKMPLAQNVDEFWQRIKSGTDCITQFPQYRKKDILPLTDYT